MAKTPYPLVWDFHRTVDGAKGLGSVMHYFNEEAQSIYLNDGLKTKTSLMDPTTPYVKNGNWEKSTFSDEISITKDTWKILKMDHVSNSCVYGIATDGKSLEFIRYMYGLDLSGIMNSWNWVCQIDNSITQFNGAVQNINPTVFGSESSLLQPGAYITIFIRMGDSEAYPITVMWLDEANYDDRSDTISISGRNTIGYYLKDQTFDGIIKDGVFTPEVTEVIFIIKPVETEGSNNNSSTESSNTYTFKEAMEIILKTYAGIDKFVIQENPKAKKNEFKFSPSESLLSGIEKILEFYVENETVKDENGNSKKIEHTWEIAEGSDGTIYIGRDDWITNYIPKGHYIFNEGRDAFTRKTIKTSDAAYTQIRVTGKGTGGSDLKAIIVPVNTYKYWSLGKHKTKHIQAPDGKTQEDLQDWAEAQAIKYQYTGITEDLTGPFRPQLLVGDVATVSHEDNEGTILGIITEVRQTFGVKDGFKTEFSVDSGGYAKGVDDVVGPVYSRSAQINGYNRKQRIVDVVRLANK